MRATRGAEAFDASSRPPQLDISEEWGRRWKVTMKRWGLGGGLVLLASLIYSSIIISRVASPTAPDELVARAMGELTGAFFSYVIWIAWWVDHLVSRYGARASFFAHLALAGLLSLRLVYAYHPLLSPLWFILGAAGLVVIGHWAASRIKDSFAPNSAGAF